MATRVRPKKTTERCEPHGVAGDCWRCCEADMREHLTRNGIDPARYFDGRNGEGTPEPRQRGNGGNQVTSHTAELATDAQVWKVRTERDRRDTSGVNLPADADIPAMSKRAASALIKDLLARPFRSADASSPRAYAPRTATPGQQAYVRDLLTERVHAAPVDVDALTFTEASTLIDVLVRAPRKVDASPLADGMYRRDGIMYRVRTDRHGRKQCHRAEIVTVAPDGTITAPAVIKFYSARHMLAQLTEADKMTEDQVCAFGVSYGICVFGHALTDPISIAAGIGPKCAENMGIDRYELAAAKGVTVPTRRTRKTRTAAPVPAPVVDPAPASATVPAPVAPVEPFVSPWALL